MSLQMLFQTASSHVVVPNYFVSDSIISFLSLVVVISDVFGLNYVVSDSIISELVITDVLVQRMMSQTPSSQMLVVRMMLSQMSSFQM